VSVGDTLTLGGRRYRILDDTREFCARFGEPEAAVFLLRDVQTGELTREAAEAVPRGAEGVQRPKPVRDPCVKCGGTERRNDGRCADCRRAYLRAWHARRKGRVTA
jgi:hypothetical protein